MYLYKNNLQNVLDINFDTKEQKNTTLQQYAVGYERQEEVA